MRRCEARKKRNCMKIKLIQKLVELDGGQFLEVFPGPFKGRSWNEQSVYIEDEAFALIESILSKHVPEFDRCRNTAISKETWTGGIIADLQELKNKLSSAKSLQDLPATMQFRDDGSREEFGADLQANSQKVITLIDELIVWLSSQLESQSVISILGI